jgi:hypothetical protein
MDIKFTNIFNCKALQNLPKFVFLVWKYTIWQPFTTPFLQSVFHTNFFWGRKKQQLLKTNSSRTIFSAEKMGPWRISSLPMRLCFQHFGKKYIYFFVIFLKAARVEEQTGIFSFSFIFSTLDWLPYSCAIWIFFLSFTITLHIESPVLPCTNSYLLPGDFNPRPSAPDVETMTARACALNLRGSTGVARWFVF